MKRKTHSGEKPAIACVSTHPATVKVEDVFNESLHGLNAVRLFVNLFQFRLLHRLVYENPIF